MADLGKLQERLHADENLRKQFFDDPVALLAKEGLTLSPEMQQAVVKLAKQAKTERKGVAGESASIKTANGISINIAINF